MDGWKNTLKKPCGKMPILASKNEIKETNIFNRVFISSLDRRGSDVSNSLRQTIDR